jgi:lipopolysaccharide biosynthesis regulator YciM
VADGSALFFGVGVDNYDADLPKLDHPIADVTAIRVLLGDRFEGEPLKDPAEQDVKTTLQALEGRFDDGQGVLVAMWSGHGVAPMSTTSLRLLAKDSRANVMGGFGPDDVLGLCALSGCNQLLFIVDTCFSGDATDAARVATEILTKVAAAGSLPPWVGVLAACSADVTARDGVFARQLIRLIQTGPADPDLRRRWSAHSPLVRGDDLCDALLKEWPATEPQTPAFQASGSAWFMVTNPLFKKDAPPQVVEHLLLAARSGTEPLSWFTGRAAEVDQVVDWVRQRRPGVHVITGSAGTGKSAVLGRVVSASVSAERERLLAQGPLGHADPGEGSIAAHAHARGLTANRLAELLNAGLERSGVLSPTEDGRPNANLLLGAIEQAAEDWQPDAAPVVAIDGLDEARGEAFDIARNLLVRLGEWVTVIVSTRNLPGEGDGPDLLGLLGPHAGLLDLDTPASAESGRQAMRSYIVNRLDGVAAAMNPERVAEEFLSRTEATAGEPFLIARLLTDQLRKDPVDTASANWRRRVITSLTQAFELDLAMLEAPHHRLEVDSAELARTLLSALTWAFGAGFPEDEWLCVAQALSDLEPPPNRDDISWLLSQLGRFVIQDGEGGVAVYRLAHQSIADLLRADPADESYEATALAVATRLMERYRALLADGMSAEQPIYLWRYAWRHAVQAGEAGLNLLRELSAGVAPLQPDMAVALHVLSLEFDAQRKYNDAVSLAEEAVDRYRVLAAENPGYLPDLATALNNLGIQYSNVGRWLDAVTPVEEAVDSYRALAAENSAFLPDLAMALNNLGIQYNDVGRWQEAVALAEEAVAGYRTLAAENPAFLPNLASALNSLSNSYGGVGRRVEAVPLVEEAVAGYRALAAENPVYLPDLAMALSNLGGRYSGVGRRLEAVPPIEEAVELRRMLAVENPAYIPELATVLNNLGNCYSEVGRPLDAVAPTEEAVAGYRALAAENSAYLPDLAMALNNLGIRYSGVGRRLDAVAPAEEAVAAYRALAAENPAFLPNLAMALNSLGIRYSGVGRRLDAVEPVEEAVAAYRALAAENPAFLPNLAMVLNNLGNRYGGVGRRLDAVEPVEEAVAGYRALAAENPAFLPDLASALNNLGIRYGEVGRSEEAVAPTEEAVELRRALAAQNPAFLPDLASALNNLGIRYGEVGRSEEAVAPTEEAVELRRALAAENPAFLPDLASVLNNLGVRYSKVERRQDALAPTEEAVELRRALAAENPAFLPDLASVLNNLGVRYSEVERRQDALALTEEAVELRRVLAAENPVFLPDLASALNNLGQYLTESGRQEEGESIWQRALDSLADQKAALLYYRAVSASPDDARAVEWLADALAEPGLDPGLGRAIHEEARRRRTDQAAFDAQWRAVTGKSVPSWLSIDADLLEAAVGWVGTPTYGQEAAWLAEHPELLDPASDAAVDEALLGIDDEEADRLRNLRAEARTDGITNAYQPILDAGLLRRFFDADLAEQVDLLDTAGDQLRRPIFRQNLSHFVANDDQGLAEVAIRAYSLIQLSESDSHRTAVEALQDPDEFGQLLRAVADDGESELLDALATLLMAEATDARQYALALFYQAAGRLLADVPREQLRPLMRSLRSLDQDVSRYINLAAAIGAKQPAALGIIPMLTEPLPEADDGEA